MASTPSAARRHSGNRTAIGWLSPHPPCICGYHGIGNGHAPPSGRLATLLCRKIILMFSEIPRRPTKGETNEMHRIQCECGAVRGEIEQSGLHNRLVCYCTDCRAFANFLGKGHEVLDAQGGTEIVQLAQSRLRFLQGEDRLSAVRLSDKGIIRWYAACCGTPIGNTVADRRVSIIGLVHSCLDSKRMDEDFGTSIAVVHAGSALGNPKPKPRGLVGVVARTLWIVYSNLVAGRYRTSPLFDESGSPRTSPHVLKPEELAELKNSV